MSRRRRHVPTERLTVLALAGPTHDQRADDRGRWHTSPPAQACAATLSRTHWPMRLAARRGLPRSRRVFDDAVLDAQRAAILDRLAHLGHAARVLRFPAVRAEAAPSRAAVNRRWISVAAAAGLHHRPGGRATRSPRALGHARRAPRPLRRPPVPAPRGSGPVIVPASSTVSRRPMTTCSTKSTRPCSCAARSRLRALDALTPARERRPESLDPPSAASHLPQGPRPQARGRRRARRELPQRARRADQGRRLSATSRAASPCTWRASSASATASIAPSTTPIRRAGAFPTAHVYLTGEIIHNPHVNDQLRAQGIRFLSDPGEADRHARARTMSSSCRPSASPIEHAAAARCGVGCTLVDTTCGSVLNVWKNVKRYAQRRLHVGHPRQVLARRDAAPRRRRPSRSHGGHYLVVLDRDRSRRSVLRLHPHGAAIASAFLERIRRRGVARLRSRSRTWSASAAPIRRRC